MSKCKHCKFLENIFGSEIKSNREYWIYTEMFVRLHNGEECNNMNNIKKVEEETPDICIHVPGKHGGYPTINGRKV